MQMRWLMTYIHSTHSIKCLNTVEISWSICPTKLFLSNIFFSFFLFLFLFLSICYSQNRFGNVLMVWQVKYRLNNLGNGRQDHRFRWTILQSVRTNFPFSGRSCTPGCFPVTNQAFTAIFYQLHPYYWIGKRSSTSSPTRPPLPMNHSSNLPSWTQKYELFFSFQTVENLITSFHEKHRPSYPPGLVLCLHKSRTLPQIKRKLCVVFFWAPIMTEKTRQQ